MNWERVRRGISVLKRALRIERRLTPEESHRLLELSEAILDHGKMLQSYYEHAMEYVMVEVPELAFRFRETPGTIKDALLLLSHMGRANPCDRDGRWLVRPGDTVRTDGDDEGHAA